MKLALFVLVTLINSVYPLNILGIFPYHGKSHFIVFQVYLRELSNRGHNVTVISHFPEQNARKNYHDISLAGSIKILEDAQPPIEFTYWNVIQIGLYLTSTGIENCEVLVANKKVQELVNNKEEFDVVVVEQFNSDCALGIAYKLGAPVVGITSHVLMPYHYDRLGIPHNPSYVSFHFFGGGTKPTLYQRLERVLFDFYFKTIYYFAQQSSWKTLVNHFGDIPPLEELGRDIKFLLLYHNFVLTGSRLLPANVIEVGGYHVEKAKSLTEDLKKFVDEAKDGIIYISFGSVIKSSSLPREKVQIILDALMEFPQRVIWKWEDNTLNVDKNKFYLKNWLPQVDILGDPKTLVFWSHAGLGGTTEAIHFGVPVIATPILGDQPSNAAAIEESGLGIRLEYKDLTKGNLVAAIKKVLNPEFHKRTKAVSKAWHDRPMSALDTAVFWTEFAARNANFSFRTPAADVPFYQYASLDILFVFLIFTFVLVILPLWLICGSKKKTVKLSAEKIKIN